MTSAFFDVLIVGAGPAGLMCAYLSQLCGMRTVIVDPSSGPLKVGRADALNARTLQLLEIVDLFDDLYPLGKKCNTSSVWQDGRFISRQSKWWDDLEGCLHKHFLMLGQSFIENTLDQKLRQRGLDVRREIRVESIQVTEEGCFSRISSGETLYSKYVIGADGSRSFVRKHFNIPFQITRPQLIWAVLDGIIETDFPKAPEIIIFQNETSDVAWIPREGDIDRFYVRMDTKNFDQGDALAKINQALRPHTLRFKEIVWFSHFSVKESVAEKFQTQERIFLAGDACHIHSVNGGQGLNTGIADAFNLIWKLNRVVTGQAPPELLQTYEAERKPAALSVVETSGELVRSTKYSDNGTHAQDYVKIVQKRAGHITGMGIRYGQQGLCGKRLFDFEIFDGTTATRIYSLLDYTQFTLLILGETQIELNPPSFMKIIQVHPRRSPTGYWTESKDYSGQAILVRPDSYIFSAAPLDHVASLVHELKNHEWFYKPAHPT